MKSFAISILAACLTALLIPCTSLAQDMDSTGQELRRAFEEIYQSECVPNGAFTPVPVVVEAPRLAARQVIEESPLDELRTDGGVYSQPAALPANGANSSLQIEDAGPVIKPASGPTITMATIGPANEQDDAGAPQSVIEMASSKMWWQPLVLQSLGERPSEQVGTDVLVQLALQNSPRILATSQTPLIEETEISVARAEFDPYLFLQSRFDDRVDPVGNDLTTGPGIPFLKDHIWTADGGIRRKLYSGGEIEVKQNLGFQNSNSRFFNPQDQGTATLSLNFSQPLLRGRGKCFNRSQIMIAQVGHGAAWDQFAAELQGELTRIVEAYWTLYYNRAVLLQKQYNVERGEVVLQKLEGRSELDSLPSQIARARAAVQSRKTELANAKRDVRNAETNIRRLIGSQETFHAVASELIPIEAPGLFRMHSELEIVIQDAMQMRPEVHQALKRAKIAAVQQDISENELLPELNLIFDTYVAALRGETDIPGAWVDHFRNSTPGYAVGLEFAVPRGRRAARARNTRQRLLLKQVRHEIDQTIFDVVAEAQIAWRQVDSAFQTVAAAGEAIRAARADLLQNEARWESFALIEGDLAEGQTPTTLLDQLLDAQQRLTNAELTYSRAVLEYKVAEIGLKRATGTLLQHQQVTFGKVCGDCGPETSLHAGQSADQVVSEPVVVPEQSDR